MTTNNRIVAMVMALCLVTGAFALTAADDSEAVSAGSMNVYIYDGSSWSEDYIGMSGYNALQALQATGKTIVADTDYILEKENDYGSYLEINDNYGKVSSIGGVGEIGANVWNVFVYNDGKWTVGIDAIGFITPFTDGAAPSANIVFYYGADTETVPDNLTNHMAGKALASLIDPTGNETYAFEFYLVIDKDYEPVIASSTIVTYLDETGSSEVWSTKTLEASDLHDGITIKGYGSNAYAALKDAVGASNIVATETPGAYNGWLEYLFGLTTEYDGTNYTYWVQYTADGHYLDFNLGAYSTLDNVPSDLGSSSENFVQNAFSLEYVLYKYY